MQSFDAFFAMGDSMSIDKYAGEVGLGACSLLFRNRDERFPEFRGLDLVHANPAARFHLLAEDGQTSPQLEQAVERLESLDGTVLVTITIGGNDLMQWWATGTRTLDAVQRRLTEFMIRLDRICTRLHRIFRKPVVLLGNIYDPTDGTGILQSGNNVSAGLPLLELMNVAIAEVALRNGAHLLDIHHHFLGHGMRHRDATYAHYNASDPSGWFVFDIEPNGRGSSEIRRLCLEVLR